MCVQACVYTHRYAYIYRAHTHAFTHTETKQANAKSGYACTQSGPPVYHSGKFSSESLGNRTGTLRAVQVQAPELSS